jgi:hypothetical protein
MPKRSGISAGRKRGRTSRRQAHAKAIGGNPFVAVLSAVKQDVDARLQGFLDSRLDAVRLHTNVVTIVDSIRDLACAEKRTRRRC